MLHLIKCFCPKHLIKNSLQFEWIAVFFFLMLLQYEVLVVLSFLTSIFMQYLQFSRKYVATNFLLNLSFTDFLCTVYINFLIIILHANDKHAYSYSLYDSSGMSLSCVLCTSTYYTHFFHLFLVYCSSVLYTCIIGCK